MEALKTLGGGAFVHMTFQVESPGFVTAGIPATWGIQPDAGVLAATATVCANFIGISQNTVADSHLASGLLTVIVNPDLITRVKLSGSTTEDTALTIATGGASGSTTTIDNITGDTPNSPERDEGIIWGYSGTNAGQYANIATTDANTVTILNAFSGTNASGDEYIIASRSVGSGGGILLSTLFSQCDAQAATSTEDDALFYVIDGEFNTVADEGTTNSFYHIYSGSSMWHGGTVIS